MSYSNNLVLKLNSIAVEYAAKIETQIRAVLSKPGYTRTGAGVESLKVTVVPGNNTKAPAIEITVADYVTILDRRKVQWTSMPPADALGEWSQNVDFTRVPGYKNGVAARLPPWKAKARVVWAIAMSKKKFDTNKPKPWRKKALSAVLKEMNEEVLIEFDKAINEDFQVAIDKEMK